MNKKAWLRIVEAFIASLIVIGAVAIIISQQETKTSEIGDDVYEKQRQILDIISNNETLREKAILNDKTAINNFISKVVPSAWGFDTAICDINEICNSTDIPNNREIYSTEIIITSTMEYYNPKKLRFFVWMK